ncbi:MAG: hypothetical protein RML57_10195 [Acidobacteriota bacterium]|nr:hypothetical protein [Acidobacteriota bacterium]
MTTLLRRSLLIILCTVLAALSGEVWAQTGATPAQPDKTIRKVVRKKMARKAARRRTARKAARRVTPKRRTVKPQPVTRVVPPVAARPAPTPVVVDAPPTVAVEQVHEQVQYTFAGYSVAADGSPVRLWHSRAYTVRSPYAYLGRMPFGGEWRHVWLETAGTRLASAVIETPAETMPDIAQMMERFPDGGLGVVVAGWDEFAPPTEPAVEVVEFGEQPGGTR